MSTGTLVAIIVPVVVVVLLICALVAWLVVRRRLKERFGSECARTIDAEGSRLAAERELREREERHDALDIKPLQADALGRYAEGWNKAQERFADQPVRRRGSSSGSATCRSSTGALWSTTASPTRSAP
ncbi:hypothetical protein [Streptomyces nigrescens]|uniref:hypothetical protein n=1 Tax=Streptomyces nigrescens TaxID=1920 RepID=UPI003489E87A